MVGTNLIMSGLGGPAFAGGAFPDSLALGGVEKANVGGSLCFALDEQGVRREPLDQNAVLVRDAWSLDLDVVRAHRLADVRGRGENAGRSGC